MGHLDVLPHQHANQGWTASVSRRSHGAQIHGGIGHFDEAVARVVEHGVTLRISIEVRAQMERAGCAPVAWPADLGFGPLK